MSISKNFLSSSGFVPSGFVSNPMSVSHKQEVTGFNRLAGLCAFLRRICFGLGRRSVVGGALEHLGSLPLTAHSSLALVRLHHETLLLGITAHSITLLSKENEAGGFEPDGSAAEPVTLREEPLSQVEGPTR